MKSIRDWYIRYTASEREALSTSQARQIENCLKSCVLVADIYNSPQHLPHHWQAVGTVLRHNGHTPEDIVIRYTEEVSYVTIRGVTLCVQSNETEDIFQAIANHIDKTISAV